MKPNTDQIVAKYINSAKFIDMARASLRYEALRRLTPVQYSAMFETSIREDVAFDSLVDMLVIDMLTPKMKAKERRA